MKYRTNNVSLLFMVIGGCILITSGPKPNTTSSIMIIIVLLLGSLLGCVYWFQYIHPKQKQQQHVRRTATWDNPAANILPYSPYFYNHTGNKLTLPPHSHETNELLRKGVPTTINDRIWNINYGARDIQPVLHIPDQVNAVQFINGDLTSCKTDRLQCLPVPNISISQKQNLTI